jgi:hypothetical protein
MIGILRNSLAALVLAATLAAPAHAAQICGWLVESIDADKVSSWDLWLQSDADVAFKYEMKGEGITTESSRMYSPGSGSFSLTAGKAERTWGFGTELEAGANIDIIAELHQAPKDIFDDDETPLLASFTFQRKVPEGETAPPRTFMEKQCVTLPADSPALRR